MLKMPLVRYFLFVGTALLALLFVVDAYLPKLLVVDGTNTAANTAMNLAVIRIHSDRKWPERVEFDTSLPTVATAPVRTAEASAPAMVAEAAAPVRTRAAFAQLQTPAQLQTSEPRKPETKPLPKRRTVASRTVAKSRVGPPTILVAQQPRLGLFANTIW